MFGLEETNDRIITTLNLNKEIVNFAISVSELSKLLKEAKKDLNHFKNNSNFDSALVNTLYSYFSTAMSTIRELSNECIKICLNVIKNTGTNYFIEKEPEKYYDWQNTKKASTQEKRISNNINRDFLHYDSVLSKVHGNLRVCGSNCRTLRDVYNELNTLTNDMKLGEIKKIDAFKYDFSELRDLLSKDSIYNKLDQQEKTYADIFLSETDPSIDIYDYNVKKLMECIVGLMAK